MPSRRLVTQGNLSQKNPLPAESRAGPAGQRRPPQAGRLHPAVPQPARPQPGRDPSRPHSPVWAGGLLLGTELISRVDVTPRPCG